MTLTQADYENARGNTGLLCSQLGLWISTKAIESWSSADNTDLLDNKTWALSLVAGVALALYGFCKFRQVYTESLSEDEDLQQLASKYAEKWMMRLVCFMTLTPPTAFISNSAWQLFLQLTFQFGSLVSAWALSLLLPPGAGFPHAFYHLVANKFSKIKFVVKANLPNQYKGQNSDRQSD